MARVSCHFKSEVLAIHTAAYVLLPQPSETVAPRERYPVLWLLHGLSDDHTIWHRRTAIERYVQDLPLAVVMPAVNRSFYHDMAYGPAYWTFVSEELPALLRHWFPLSEKREENFVAGLSMGGYGALKLALRHPERFAAVASLSGVTLHAREPMWDPMLERDFRLMLGDNLTPRDGDLDLVALSSQVAASGAPRPATWLYCGDADFLYDQNVTFHNHLESIGWEHRWLSRPGGDHTWPYWDEQIEQVIAWLPLK